jgi:hypothetical protein
MKHQTHSIDLTHEEKIEVVRLYRELGHTRLVVEKTGKTWSQIQYALESAGIPLFGGRLGACYKNRDVVEKMAREGASLSSIAEKIGTNKKTVKRFVQRMNLERKPHVQSGSNNPAWKGGRMTDKDGYVLIHQPSHPAANRHGYVREHRLVMEKKIGRFLLPNEAVHHDPKVAKSDNRPEVLTVFASNADHLRHELTGKVPKWTPEGFARMKSRRNPRPKLTSPSSILTA